MGNIPSGRDELLEFAQSHYPLYEENYESIGLTLEQATAMRTTALQVQGQTLTNQSLRLQLRTGTQELAEDYAALRRAVSSAVRSINAFAQNSPKPINIYNAAQIAPPAPRGPSVPPASPTSLTVALDPVAGTLRLRWRATQPRGVTGVVYIIRRRVGESGPDVGIGSIGSKSFIDSNVPSEPILTYTVQAQRGNLFSATMAAITVRFGSGGGGMTVSTAQIAATADSKAAA